MHVIGEFLKVYHNAHKTPQDKYTLPQTAAQEIGWDIKPLVSDTTDTIINNTD